MEHLPIYISLLFILTTGLTVFFFFKAAHFSKWPMLLVAGWLTITMLFALNNFFTVTNTLPPRFIFLVAPPLLLIIATFITARGRQFLDQLDQRTLTLLHVVRVPVEVVLFLLFLYKAVPELMTFEGRNFDILSGLSAPLIYYFGFVKQKLNHKILVVWHVVCLLLLFNIVTHAVLSAPSPFQQLAFEQPNRAVLYFPFVWLPGCIVPLVFFSHLISLRSLLFSKSNTTASKSLSEAELTYKY